MSAVAEPSLSDQVLGRLRSGHARETILSWVRKARQLSIPPSSSALLAVSEHADREASYGRGISSDGTSLAALDESCNSQPPAGTGHNSQPSSITDNTEYTPGDMAMFTGLEEVLWPLGAPTTAPSPEIWTDLTGDTILIRHLMALYFCWEYPLFASISREHFMNDFHEGRHRYCSPLLVNSILALGSCWNAQPTSQTKSTGFNTNGDRFFEESVRLLGEEVDRRSLTTIQALGIMSLREINRGRDAEARYYSIQCIRLAIDMGLHRKLDSGDWDLHYVQTSTFWGAFSLDA